MVGGWPEQIRYPGKISIRRLLMMLKDKVSIITGAGSGIGKGIALRFAREGSDVVLVGRTMEKLEKVAKEIEVLGRKILLVQADISLTSDVERIFDHTVDNFGEFDILVNNAGVNEV